ncbi:MAG: hypothetical protein KDC45_15330 [Bacteroidetes bacterium]|nr:hypothetical protein [Bacteroidota bacterium]
MKHLTVLGALFIAGVFLTGCPTDDPLTPAWDAFSTRNYPAAYALFSEQAPTVGAPAYVGLGWTTMRMDSLVQSDSYFAVAAASDTLVDAFAGWAVLGWIRGQHAECAERVNIVFTLTEGYIFPYDREIRGEDLYLHQAFSYYYLQDYAKCVGSIQKIDPAFALAISDPQRDVKLLTKLQQLSDALR